MAVDQEFTHNSTVYLDRRITKSKSYIYWGRTGRGRGVVSPFRRTEASQKLVGEKEENFFFKKKSILGKEQQTTLEAGLSS